MASSTRLTIKRYLFTGYLKYDVIAEGVGCIGSYYQHMAEDTLQVQLPGRDSYTVASPSQALHDIANHAGIVQYHVQQRYRRKTIHHR